jgi:hypothetical protein
MSAHCICVYFSPLLTVFQGCQISVKEFSMEDDRDPNFHPRNAATAFPVNMTPARPPYMQVNSPARAMYTPNSSNSSHGVRLSPTGRSTVPINDPATAMWGPSPTAVARVRRSAADLNHARNQVEIPRIRMGIDVRTTVSVLSTQPTSRCSLLTHL